MQSSFGRHSLKDSNFKALDKHTIPTFALHMEDSFNIDYSLK